MKVFTLPTLKDNYNFIIYDEASQTRAVVDPSGFEPTHSFLQERGWDLQWILNTHQHPDHIGGNIQLKEKYSCQIVASKYDKERGRIPGCDRSIQEGESLKIGPLEAQILFIPGHTLGHIAYYFPKYHKLFCGDTLFSLGCGRLFEGSAEDLLRSLKKIKSLPPETTIYCAHEYTAQNGQFALQVDPHNKSLQTYYKKVIHQIKEKQFTVPFQLSDQLECNPFFRANDEGIAQQLNLKTPANELEVFTLLRQKKDHF